jgi:hypothetical protein
MLLKQANNHHIKYNSVQTVSTCNESDQGFCLLAVLVSAQELVLRVVDIALCRVFVSSYCSSMQDNVL